MSDTRPIIVGMNNPVSSRPEHALYPWPPRCTGWRILEMLRTRRPDVTRAQYLAAFDRRNLLSSRRWDRAEARTAAEKFLRDLPSLRGRTILILGVEVRRLLGVPPLLVHPQEMGGATWRQLPHPSGLCRWYNDRRHAATAALLLEELYAESEGVRHVYDNTTYADKRRVGSQRVRGSARRSATTARAR